MKRNDCTQVITTQLEYNINIVESFLPKNSHKRMKTNLLTSFAPSMSVLAGLAMMATAQAQPTFSSISPDGSHLFQPSGTLSFNVSSAPGVTNVSVTLTSTTLQGASRLKTLTAGHGLTITGPANAWSVSAGLASNILYAAVITAQDATGASASTSVNFDTIAPAYTFEAEDYNYTDTNTMTSGLYIDNPQTNAYRNLYSSIYVDAVGSTDGGAHHDYRPADPSYPGNQLATEGCSDTPRVQYMSGQGDYDIGWTGGGQFGNYTRHFPSGSFNVYMRAADGGGTTTPSAAVFVDNAPLGQFNVPNTGGWQSYTYVPLVDSGGNLVVLDTDGAEHTFLLNINGGFNANFFLLMPTNPPTPPGPAISGVYPDGVWQFEQTNTLSFTVTSAAGVDPSGIQVLLSGTNLNGLGSSQALTSGNGLTLSGSANNWTVTAALATNKTYSAFIQVADANDNASSTTVKFDTLPTTYFTFEAEDFDYSTNGVTGGLFIDNTPGVYSGLSAIDGIDFHLGGSPNNSPYRGDVHAVPPTSLNTETAGDQKRLAYDLGSGGVQDYDLGNTANGDWGNYTRTIPGGIYNIYVRASGNGGVSSMSQVTAGFGTSSQTLLALGTFTIPATGGWQTYQWVPLRDSAGNLVRFTGGGVKTLRFNNGGNINLSYFMLVPADNSLPTITQLYPDGSSWYQYTNKLSFLASSSDGMAQSGITVTLDGLLVSGLTFSGSSTAWAVSCPITVNAAHTVVISVTTLTGLNKTSTIQFDTFKAGYYTFEAEDFDYNGGRFYDNPQVDSYNGLAPVPDVDNHQSDLNATRTFAYRPNDDAAAPVPGTTTAGDTARNFTGGTDYNIGFFGGGSWVNFTRHYPAGTYNIWGRFAEGAAPSQLDMGVLTGGYGTTNQTSAMLGTFHVAQGGWSTWEWAPLLAANGQLATITMNGGQQTLKLLGSPLLTLPEVNVNFFMLTPSGNVTLTAARASNTTSLSFQTMTGFSYQVQSKDSLSDATWANVGAAVGGDNTVHTVTDTTSVKGRFYRAAVSQ
jgi:hypothetical protein